MTKHFSSQMALELREMGRFRRQKSKAVVGARSRGSIGRVVVVVRSFFLLYC